MKKIEIKSDVIVGICFILLGFIVFVSVATTAIMYGVGILLILYGIKRVFDITIDCE